MDLEENDIYDAARHLTGKVHLRGTPWKRGQYGLVVCVWVYDGRGNLLLTRRAKEKSFPGTWENSGGAAKAGESSRTAIARELYEETGIRAEESAFELIDTTRDGNTFYDFYCISCDIPIEQIRLQPGETDGALWASYETVHRMVDSGQICHIIARQFLRQEQMLRARNPHNLNR